MELHTPRKKAIILTAAAGQGHLSAAHAFDYWLSQFNYNTQILDIVPAIGEDSYKIVVKSPRTWKAFFELSNRETFSKPIIKRFSKILEHKLMKISPGYTDADLIVSTYFLIHPVYGKKQVMVLLDPLVHSAYLTEPGNTYFIAFWEMSLKEIGNKQPESMNKTFLTGPVVRSDFYTHAKLLNENDKSYFKKLLNIPLDYKLILITAGGNWIYRSEGHIEEFHNQFKDEKVIFAFACGKNANFREKMLNEYSSYNKFVFLPWLNGDQMATWMCAADYGISFTLAQMIAEAGLSKMPLLVYNVIPGQEEGYKSVVEERGVGKYIKGDPKDQTIAAKQIITGENIFDDSKIIEWQKYLLSAPERLREVMEKITDTD